MLVLPRDLTRSQANACLQMLVQGLPAVSANPVVVDAAALERFDSSALAVLLELRRETLVQGKSLVIRALPDRLRDLATVYGIAELLPGA
jgi:phospholipid transport system transporter-binding protein